MFGRLGSLPQIQNMSATVAAPIAASARPPIALHLSAVSTFCLGVRGGRAPPNRVVFRCRRAAGLKRASLRLRLETKPCGLLSMGLRRGRGMQTREPTRLPALPRPACPSDHDAAGLL